jgi:hypothetical protein
MWLLRKLLFSLAGTVRLNWGFAVECADCREGRQRADSCGRPPDVLGALCANLPWAGLRPTATRWGGTSP